MPGQLCPKCGQFGLEFKPGYLNEEDCYVCFFCGAKIPASEIGASLDPDSLQRFPSGKDAEPSCPLNEFLKRKKQ